MLLEKICELVQQWDRRHGLLEGRPALVAIEAPHTTTSTSTAIISSTSTSVSVPSSVATRDDQVIDTFDESGCGDEVLVGQHFPL